MDQQVDTSAEHDVQNRVNHSIYDGSRWVGCGHMGISTRIPTRIWVIWGWVWDQSKLGIRPRNRPNRGICHGIGQTRHIGSESRLSGQIRGIPGILGIWCLGSEIGHLGQKSAIWVQIWVWRVQIRGIPGFWTVWRVQIRGIPGICRIPRGNQNSGEISSSDKGAF